MIRKIVTVALVIMALVAICLPALAEDDYDPRAGYYYVKTGNGKGLNVRDGVNGNVVGSLKYGTRIYVSGFTTPEWALITYKYNKPGYGYGEYAAWVSTRYLTRTNPGKYNPDDPTPTGGTTVNGLASVNAIFRTARQVPAPYYVVARPSRASGWVNLRWAPSTDAERITGCEQGKQLLVLAEMKDWLQVQDPATGMIGFIMTKFVQQLTIY